MSFCRHVVPVALAGVLLLAAPALATGSAPQTSNRLSDARRALNEGRYGEVATLAGAAASAGDPQAAVLRARASLATGKYEEAETVLRQAAAAQPSSDAALELGLLLIYLGRRQEAKPLLVPLVEPAPSAGPGELVRAGRAARALGEYETANQLMQMAEAASPGDMDVNVAWGDLFLEKHNLDDARRCFETALRSDGRDVAALVGMARAGREDDFAASLASTRAALEINRSSVEALLLMAEMLLDAGHEGGARAALESALAVNPRRPEAHALVAAIARLNNRSAEFDQAMARALAVNSRFGEAYRVVASQLASHYRFDEAVELARKAVTTDPANIRARADLGMDLLRTGDEDGAREALKKAFEEDPYDAITYNLLAVLDALDAFETVRDGDIVVKLDPKEAPVLAQPVLALARDALRTFAARYGYSPRGPILIEVFPHHDDFAVRNLGIPGLVGALGACFGRVVTMDSPKARPPGTFDWRATLWHELAHVVTLQMSSQRIPRWLTEGISVYEEQRARPEWRRPMEPALVAALDQRTIPGLSDIEASFADPATISLAYYHAGLVVKYLMEAYGQEKFNALVASFASGIDTPTAFSRAFGATLDQVQAGFAQSLDKSMGPLRRALKQPPVPLDGVSGEKLKALAAQHQDNYRVQMALAAALRSEGDYEGAKQALNRAAELFPSAVGAQSPRALLGEMALERGDVTAALAEFEKQLAQDALNIELARRVSGMLSEETAPERVRRANEIVAALDPFDADAHSTLGRLAVKRSDAAAAIVEFKAAIAAGPGDVAGARCDLAEAYLLSGDRVQARRETLAVLEQAPTFQRAQELLLKIVEGVR